MSIGLVVYPDLCHACGNCVVSCPVNASNNPEVAGGKGPSDNFDNMVLLVENGEITIPNADLCGKCGTCVELCPVFAVQLEELGDA